MPTQSQLILKYVAENGSIVPARMGGHSYAGGFFGSEVTRAARKLRTAGILSSHQEGRYERFYANRSHVLWNTVREPQKSYEVSML